MKCTTKNSFTSHWFTEEFTSEKYFARTQLLKQTKIFRLCTHRKLHFDFLISFCNYSENMYNERKISNCCLVQVRQVFYTFSLIAKFNMHGTYLIWNNSFVLLKTTVQHTTITKIPKKYVQNKQQTLTPTHAHAEIRRVCGVCSEQEEETWNFSVWMRAEEREIFQIN